ncbi:MAG: hypothetical protein ACOC6P_04005, partial [Candidatus Aminicenantaceae bacterium]
MGRHKKEKKIKAKSKFLRKAHPQQAGFFRRFFAFTLDMIIILVMPMVSSTIFSSVFQQPKWRELIIE